VQFSFQNPLQVLKDMGLGAISIFSWLLGLLCTAHLLPKDKEDRTLYTILAKPVSRFEYLLGKLGGVYMLLALSVLVMSAMFGGILALREKQEIAFLTQTTSPELLPSAVEALRESAFNFNLVPGILLILLKALLCSTLTLLLSTVASSSVFTLLSSVVIYLIGHLQGIAREAWQHAEQGTAALKVLSAFVALFPSRVDISSINEISTGFYVSIKHCK
jgi:ABC-type transport system involved in multi-copper enzyme maturation permease subunit